MLPNSLLLSKFKSSNKVKLPKLDGIVPSSELCSARKEVSLFKLPISSSRVPVMVLYDTLIDSSSNNMVMVEGNTPPIKFWPTLNSLRCGKPCISLGSFPDKLLFSVNQRAWET